MKRLVRSSIAVATTLVLAAPAVTAAASSRPSGDEVTAGRSVSRVKIVDFRFRPGTLTVSRGDVVRWRNRGNVTHTSTSSTWDSGRLAPGETFRRRFRRAGTFEYHCTIHPQMTGTIVVR